MIYVLADIYKVDKHHELDHTGPLIDLLQSHWPDGFPGPSSAIYVNSQLLPVEDYDYDVSPSDTVVIMPSIPAGLETATIMLLVQIAVLLISVAFTLLTMPKAKQRTKGSRVYSIGSGQNVPALGEIITEHFGQLWCYPDVASQPYAQFVGNEQYINQILLIGAGKYRLDEIRVGNTPLNLIPPGLVEYQLFLPADHKAQYGQIQSQFGIYEDVVSSVDVQGLDFARNSNTTWAGQAPDNAGNGMKGAEYPTGFKAGDVMTFIGRPGWAMHESVKTITSIGSDGKMFFSSLVADNHWYMLAKDYDGGWRGWFAACPVGKTTDRIEVDFEFPNGLVYTTNEGGLKNMSCWIDLQIQQIDDNDIDVGAPIIRQFLYTNNNRDPQRRTESIAVPAGRYKVRARRNDEDDIVTQTTSKVYWNGLKAYCINTTGSFAYGDVTLLAMRLKASEALSSSSDKIMVKATRILPTTLSDFTVEAPTTNVCDAFAQVVREADPGGVDLPALKVTAQRWNATNGFNYRFENATTVYAALQTIGLSHRAQPQAYARLLSLRPDDAKPYDQFVISQEQMRADSYRCGINIGPVNGDIDGFRIGYQDPNGVTELFVVWPSLALSPQETSLDGCTNQNTALQQAKYLWARKDQLRRLVTFDTEFDSLAFSIGDRIAVLSNVLDTVQTVRVLAVNGLVLTVDGLAVSAACVVRLRDQYGQPSDLINASMDGNQLTLSAAPPFPIFGIDSGQESTTVIVGQLTSFSRSYQVTEIVPATDSVNVSATTYTDAPYLYPIPGEVIPP